MTIITNIQQELKDRAREAKKKAKRGIKFLEENALEINRIETGLAPVKEWFINSDIDIVNRCVDLSYAGDKHVLEGIFAALRKMGYQPTSRPKEDKMTSFSTFFDNNETGLRIWISFSSTQCKRVKVGSRFVEQDVYEIVCE